MEWADQDFEPGGRGERQDEQLACVPFFILATEDIGFKRRAEDVIISNIAKMLHVNKDYIDNPQGMIDILIGLESANLLLREVHYVAGIPVKKSFYTKDIMLGNSVLTNKMVIKSAIGGMTFGEANSIYYSDSQPANLYCEAQNCTFHVKNIPSIELMLRSANVSQTLAARITNPLRTVRMDTLKS